MYMFHKIDFLFKIKLRLSFRVGFQITATYVQPEIFSLFTQSQDHHFKINILRVSIRSVHVEGQGPYI